MACSLLDDLPVRLASRTRPLRDCTARDGAYVLYAVSANLRADENQTLDTAITLGNALGLPVLAAIELTEWYPFASDRHHRFLLEGARDMVTALRSQGVRAVAFVRRPGWREPVLPALAAEAAAVVCDDNPIRAERTHRQHLLNATAAPVLAVDAACVVPMVQVRRAYDRAYKFRTATETAREDRLIAGFPPITPAVAVYDGAMPEQPTDLDAWDLGELTSACAIDHSVPPVPEFPGGETAAAARWASFRDHRLAGYAAWRNDALQEAYVSRLSPYLRHGMIAATRMAREAAQRGGKGAEKFLDELLVWREMGWAYAFHEPDHDDARTVVPDWAWESLDHAAADGREPLYAWELLARGRTDDIFWNAAQTAYLQRGYLHNNVRMTWGKALLRWTEGPANAARMLLDLNNRFGLDGGDPNSYQGLFWCLGAFDRPFEPPKPVFGTVRARSTAIHADRLDPAAFAAKQVRRPPQEQPSVAVIGGGPAGVMAARTLSDQGASVTVLDKGRRLGGRTATKRLDDGRHADHGAPWLTAADTRLLPLMTSWRETGRIEPWPDTEAALAGAHVAVPYSRALADHVARDLDVHSGVAATGLVREGNAWWVTTDGEPCGPVDWVVVAVPAPQAGSLLEPVPHLADATKRVSYLSILTAIARFDRPLDAVPDVAHGPPPLALSVRDTAKPGRTAGGEVRVLHAEPAWSEARLEIPAAASAATMVSAFRTATDAPEPVSVAGHRWRYAQVARGLDTACMVDRSAGVAVCGDWCPGGGVADAWLSGMAAAGRVLNADPAIAERGAPRPAHAPSGVDGSSLGSSRFKRF